MTLGRVNLVVGIHECIIVAPEQQHGRWVPNCQQSHGMVITMAWHWQAFH
jgi:hypothetical protein